MRFSPHGCKTPHLSLPSYSHHRIFSDAFFNAFRAFFLPAMSHAKRYSISKRYSWGVANDASPAPGNPNNLLATSGRIAWLADLDTARPPAKNYRRTSIICTIGPKTNSVESINKLRKVS